MEVITELSLYLGDYDITQTQEMPACTYLCLLDLIHVGFTLAFLWTAGHDFIQSFLALNGKMT